MEKIFKNFNANQGTRAELDLLESLFVNIEGRTICALADAAVWPLRSIIRKFRDEFVAKMTPEEQEAERAASEAEPVGAAS